ncbi:capsid protein [Hylemonella gracilis str. Niagara R]|uniref:Capsid protein n=1 Tax=Hylemonella gracilis str. Niagara R TaxID=1458275 RepID=A0A016XHZ7_9BURK|nr:phage major capsid protein, P2 family [Hylemonella gracilis]EYC51461.1 capsid protein [Hylemonella gracilis str. Niagara R]
MRNDTRQKFTAYLERLAQLNGVASATQQFTAAPSTQQTLEAKLQESSEFLKLINMIGVDQQSGEKIHPDVSSPVAGRTNTDTDGVRQPRSMGAAQGQGYFCRQTDFDTGIKYATLDAWARFPDFQIRVRDAVLKRQALDRIMIGFNGRTAAATTNRQANPLLQDVNIGWLQKIRTDAPTHVMDGGAESENAIYVDEGGNADYDSLDQLVFDAHATLIAEWFQEDPQIVAIVGRSLMSDKLFPLASGANAPTEQLAAQVLRSQRRLGGLQAITAPFMPPDAVLITSLSNLSVYWQIGTRRRYIKDEPEKNRIANYESVNEDYVVEDYDRCALIENIVLGPVPAEEPEGGQ